MASTYGESWALFHSDMTAPGKAYHSSAGFLDDLPPSEPAAAMSISTATARSRLHSRSIESLTILDYTTLAEIQRLQGELNELKRAPSLSPEPLEVAQPSQQASAPSSMRNSTHDAANSSSNLPRCWGRCCNGRAFSTPSNLARHQREKRGEAAKLRCSFCNATFSRSSARNAHETEKRCRNDNINVSNHDSDHDGE